MPPSPAPVIPLSFHPRDCVYHRAVTRREDWPANKAADGCSAGAASMNQGGLVAVLERVVGREQHASSSSRRSCSAAAPAKRRRRCSVSRQASVLATGYHVLASEAAEKQR